MSALPKNERLFEQRLISLLFGKGRRLTVGGGDGSLRVCYIVLPRQVVDEGRESLSDVQCKISVNVLSCGPVRVSGSGSEGHFDGPVDGAQASVQVSDVRCKVLVNAPKSRFKHAVDRNRIKRLLREAFRFHKDLFTGLAEENAVLLLSLQFVGNKNVSLPQMLQQVEKVGKSLRSRLDSK